MKPEITIRTLTDGGQRPLDIAAAIAGFLDGAHRTLELAQYDFDLGIETAGIVSAAIRRAAARGVRIRLAYNVDHGRLIPVPPPPSPDESLIESLPVEAFPIAGVPDLMHHKYMVRDSRTVWTGSTNWTDDAWERQENVIVVSTHPTSRRHSGASSTSCSKRGPSPRRGGSRPNGTTASGRGSRRVTAKISRIASRRQSAARGAACGSARRC